MTDSSSPTKDDQDQEATNLPALQRACLDRETLDQLFFDIAEAAELIDIVLKLGPTAHAAEGAPPSLDEARRRLIEGEVLGIQLRYRYRGAEWWDTLFRGADGIELVRIEHGLPSGEPRAEGTNR